MNRLSLALPLLALALGAAHAAPPPKEKVKLARKTQKGDRLLVKEGSRTGYTAHWKGEGEGSAGGEEIEEVEREFLQEVVKESPLVVKREYKLSTRLKGKPKDDTLEPVRTSIHGKTVLIGPDGPHLEGGILSKDDREGIDTIERIAYALLPKEEVGVGDSWKVSDEIGKAVFRNFYDGENVKTAGTAKLESIRTVDGKRVAKLLLKAALEVKQTEVVPLVTIQLAGTAHFFVDDGAFQELALEGPIHLEQHKGKTSWSADGRTAYRMKGTIVAGAAQKPLAKDDELARAEKVKCEKGHEFPNRFAFCGSCGKQLDPETHRCKGGCAPLLRFCPLCGEALAPKK